VIETFSIPTEVDGLKEMAIRELPAAVQTSFRLGKTV